MKNYLFAIALTILLLHTAAVAEEGPYPFRAVSANETHVVFSYAYDLWTVPRSGGVAKRLTEGSSLDMRLAVSPDGKTVAFTRNIGGDGDIYVVPMAGGEAKRLTWHPKFDDIVGWTPDGTRILFESTRTGDRPPKLWTISLDGIEAQALPLPQGVWGSYNADGSHIAYVPWFMRTESFRNFRGGMTTPIYIADLSDSSVRELPRENSNDYYPAWHGDHIYFISDRDGTFNLFRHNLKSGSTDQLSNFKKWDIRIAAGGAGCYAFVREGAIYVYDYSDEKLQRIDVRIPEDVLKLDPVTVDATAFVNNFLASPDGSEIVIEARGDVFRFNIDTGEHKNLTATNGTHERNPAWSPDGRRISWFSDASGVYRLHVYDTANEEVKEFDIEQDPSYYHQPTWSKDGRMLAFHDARFRLWVFNIDSGAGRIIAEQKSPYQEEYFPAFSPDGRWLTYSQYGANNIMAVHLMNLQTGERAVVSDTMLISSRPVFDRNGLYLYFLQKNSAGAAEESLGSASILYRPLSKMRVACVALRADAPSPMLAGDAVTKPLEGPFHVDLEGIENRRVLLGLPERSYEEIRPAGPGSFFLSEDVESAPLGESGSTPLYRVSLAPMRPKTEVVVEDIGSFEISHDLSRTIFFSRGGISWAALEGEKAGEVQNVEVKGLNITVDLRAEWRQMLREALRIQKHYFYSPNLHGQDLAALEAHFLPYIDRCITRRGLTNILREMLSHMSISHMGVGGGDTKSSGRGQRFADLGADFTIENGRFRITKIYQGDGSNSLLNGPLAAPGIDANIGDYLIKVGETEVTTDRNLFSYLVASQRGPLQITVSATPDGANPRTSTVVPIAGSNTLRKFDWIDQNRKRVEQASGGRLAYIFITDFGPPGIERFVKQYWAQIDKEGVILDHRYSPGGSPGDFHIDTLLRKVHSYYTFRHGPDQPFPSGQLPGPRVLLVNEWNASSTDTFPAMFRSANLGTIVGKRTMGAGIGGWHALPRLIDGGRISSPNRAYYEPGTWSIENIGVPPHVEVDLDPAAWRKGIDPQLEKAIEIALAELKKNPAKPVKRPAYPVYR